jgi:branched-chain amino acid transport system substrate-binding protein
MGHNNKNQSEERSRRAFLWHGLGTSAGVAGLSLAGCLGGDGNGGGGDGGDGTTGSGAMTDEDGGTSGDGGTSDGGTAGGGGGESLRVPGLYDVSGPTADVGRPTAIGSRDFITYLNENDVLGRQIDHPNQDYAYEVPQAKQLFDEYTSPNEPPVIVGWGTADTEALASQVAEMEIVYISASYAASLLEEATSYNFFGNLDYTSQVRSHIKWIADNDSGATVGFIYPNNPFGESPIEGGRQYAEELGLEVADDINLPLDANSARTQVQRARQNDIQYLIHHSTAAPMQVLLQDVYPELTVMGTTYTVDEFRVNQSPELFEGVRYASGFKTFAESLESDGRGAEAIQASFEREGRSTDNPEVANLNYVRGTIHGLIMIKGIREAIDLDLDPSMGSNVRQGLFETDGWDVWGLAEPFTYEEGDRRPTMNGRLYEVTDGTMEFDTTIELPRREEWIGL